MQPEEGKRADGAQNAAKPKPRYKRGRSKTRRDKPDGKRQEIEQGQGGTQNARTGRQKRRRRFNKNRRGNAQQKAAERQVDQQQVNRDADHDVHPDAREVRGSHDKRIVKPGPPETNGMSAPNELDLKHLKDREDDVEVVESDNATAADDSAAGDESESVLVVGVRFRKSGKIYYFSPNQLDLDQGDSVIVETARGVEFGTIVCGPKQIPVSEVVLPLKPVLRKASLEDRQKAADNEERERQAFEICLGKIAKHELPMKLVDVEYTFDRNKLVFYFTAEGRVDFRELVKDLAAVFRTRIELRQIGVRDEAKMVGGLGCCGRPMCCASFLGDFEPVSIKMAKEQNLSLNPAKISGVCGRLMCCLRYEYEAYKACRHGLPKVGQEVTTARGKAKVVDMDVLRRLVRLDFGDGEQQMVCVDEIIRSDPKA